ncbi:hypothetical protein B0T10DRAFT_521116 [Thelonectria olida]|uniref:Uncharacterized protein n=1 Tax=Thelonectria olida TaxID=1576542 RepID=A0A9P8VTT9_9HYPO|nr:hypothetical protein B0T10DRAFT_521116 [Thelonectria olida]
MAHSIQLGLHDPGDDERETQLQDAFQDLVDGAISPQDAARAIDGIITSDCQEAYEAYRSWQASAEKQSDNESVPGPQPAGWQKYLWDCFGMSAMKMAAESPAQDRLVDLFKELQNLPRHTVPWLCNGEMIEKTLWELTRQNSYDYFDQWMWELDQGHFVCGNVGGDPNVATSYINFSAFQARLFGSHIAAITRLSALMRLSSIGIPRAGTLDEHDKVSRAAPRVRAAAQWIFYADEALYEMCEKGALVSIGSPRWTRLRWDAWKTKFDAVGTDARFDEETRQCATKVSDRMSALQTRGLGDRPSVIDAFGFLIPEEDDDDEEDER